MCLLILCRCSHCLFRVCTVCIVKCQQSFPPPLPPFSVAGFDSSKSKLDDKLGIEGSYFRPESPYLPGSAMRRTDKPVDLEELQQNVKNPESRQLVKMKNVSASWSGSKDKLVLSDISFEVKKVSETANKHVRRCTCIIIQI